MLELVVVELKALIGEDTVEDTELSAVELTALIAKDSAEDMTFRVVELKDLRDEDAVGGIADFLEMSVERLEAD